MASHELGIRTLEAHRIVATLQRLEARVGERFPGRGLAAVCGELVTVAKATQQRVTRARRPNILLRVAVGAVVVGTVAGAAQLGSLVAPLLIEYFEGAAGAARIGELTQVFESGVNLVILAALAIWFLVSLEARWTRRGVLKHLHELRSFAHVVDMHQLTKDPVSILNPTLRMAHSPERDLTPGQLARYLDYCVEMLSLIGKLAALYAEHTDDAQVIDASNDVEDLTTNLSRKIWQKIMITGAGLGPEHAAAP